MKDINAYIRQLEDCYTEISEGTDALSRLAEINTMVLRLRDSIVDEEAETIARDLFTHQIGTALLAYYTRSVMEENVPLFPRCFDDLKAKYFIGCDIPELLHQRCSGMVYDLAEIRIKSLLSKCRKEFEAIGDEPDRMTTAIRLALMS